MLNEIFGSPDFVIYESAIVGNLVRLKVSYDITEDSIEEAETAIDPVSEFRREFTHLAWQASGNM